MTRNARTLLGIPVVVLTASALIGCGSNDASQQQIEQASTQAAAQQKIKDKQAQLEKELRALKAQRQKASHAASSGGAGSSGASSGGSVPSAAAACGGGVSAGTNTSCAFALNVATAYFQANGGSPSVSVYSPVTQQTYTMTCTGGAPTICRGGNNATVYIR